MLKFIFSKVYTKFISQSDQYCEMINK